ncbi:arylsulfatase [Nonomuraea maritima]|uniref:Arylsulfatase n=1 Tax=Nonomuraea maritima TaxID=683260 RepID=A0A1G9BNQ4_9ACTN|nr:sulfatase-like hydrolase/transferase [Nonomuraea maritima]SDK41122.1 arylsulfatase [Nonomuraea maritima]
MREQFRGIVDLDVRDSRQDWAPYLAPQARADAPNVLYVLWDDTGIAAWDTFGGLVETPNLTRVARLGLRYTQWHTTAMCSPTRASLLTGRNHHKNGVATVVDFAMGFPGANAVIPPENGTVAEVLAENGYNTYCLGKWHLTPSSELSMGSSRRTWPLARGFERFYGFHGGETNQFFPHLTYDSHFVDQPYGPDEGYHLSRDLVDKAIEFIRDGKQVAPDKPWFTYLALGATHAPHHAPQEWIDKYRGKFDMGYDRYREIVLENQKRLGIVPPDTELSPMNPWPSPDVVTERDEVAPWDSLSDGQKRVFARMAEAFAGFCSYTDHELGRLIDCLEESGQLDNTIIVVMSDNGASGEGTPHGSINENKGFNGYPEDPAENLEKIDKIGTPEAYNQYPTGWAWAFNTPYKLFKRFSTNGGTVAPAIITWAREMREVAGQVRDQYHHVIDITPTVYDCLGITAPRVVKGYAQTPLQGVSMRYSFASGTVESTRRTQYHAMLGTRSIYHDGWKAVARHGTGTGHGGFADDEWELYHVRTDRSETRELSREHPGKLRELIALWYVEAGRNDVLPLDDRVPREIMTMDRPGPAPARERYVYHPATSEVPEEAAVDVRNRSFTLTAEFEITTEDAEGVLFAHGSRFGGHALYLRGRRLHYVYNFLGIEEYRFSADAPLAAGRHVAVARFDKEREQPRYVADGTLTLSVDNTTVASGRIRTQPGKFSVAGEGLVIGRDTGDAVTGDYAAPFPFRGGVIAQVSVQVPMAAETDAEAEAEAVLARD